MNQTTRVTGTVNISLQFSNLWLTFRKTWILHRGSAIHFSAQKIWKCLAIERREQTGCDLMLSLYHSHIWNAKCIHTARVHSSSMPGENCQYVKNTGNTIAFDGSHPSTIKCTEPRIPGQNHTDTKASQKGQERNITNQPDRKPAHAK